MFGNCLPVTSFLHHSSGNNELYNLDQWQDLCWSLQLHGELSWCHTQCKFGRSSPLYWSQTLIWPIMTLQPLFSSVSAFRPKTPVSQIQRGVTETTLLKSWWAIQPLSTSELPNGLPATLSLFMHSTFLSFTEHLWIAYQEQASVVHSVEDSSLWASLSLESSLHHSSPL
jgi:hypothetical protein